MTGMDSVGKWAKGDSYGPILKQTDLYLLGVPLELNPILKAAEDKFHLSFDIRTGHAGGFDPANRDRDLEFTQRQQPATLPRVEELILISKWSPWCTVVKNVADGVTMEDVLNAIHNDYAKKTITEGEINSLKPRQQDQLRRFAQSNANHLNNMWNAQPYYAQASAVPPGQWKRCDWLKDRCWFERLNNTGEEHYIKQRLGYNAPNIFVMDLSVG